MSSKLEKKISIPTGLVKDAIIAVMEPVWITAGLIKRNEQVVDLEFNWKGQTNPEFIPVTLKINKEQEVYLEVINA